MDISPTEINNNEEKPATRPPIKEIEKTKLWVRSGGRCAFCNKYLLEDEHFEIFEIPLGEMAHIVGWSQAKKSPRGQSDLPLEERNTADNLVLLCPEHHKTIDTPELLAKFTVERLLNQKDRHETRIRHLTSLKEDDRTVVIRMYGSIRGANAEVSREHASDVVFAHARRFPNFSLSLDRHGIEINTSGLPDLTEEMWEPFWLMGSRIIDQCITQIREGVHKGSIRHLSVFALDRIPLLTYFGYRLDDKIPSTFYQKHRGAEESWLWSDNAETVSFEAKQIRSSDAPEKVALVLSLSGTIALAELPGHIDDSFNIFEISPLGVTANRDILRSYASLQNFTECYHAFLSQLEVSHKVARHIHLFPAVPITAAIACGRGIMREAQPAIHVYDRLKNSYKIALTINQ
jgi:hypothetical protein